MWVLYARAPTPTASYWPGRRLLALIDAILWPSLVAFGVTRMPMDPGMVGQVVLALCALSALRRCARALWCNERYRFTTWRVGGVLFGMLVFGAVLTLAA
jgi:hypothetical protein